MKRFVPMLLCLPFLLISTGSVMGIDWISAEVESYSAGGSAAHHLAWDPPAASQEFNDTAGVTFTSGYARCELDGPQKISGDANADSDTYAMAAHNNHRHWRMSVEADADADTPDANGAGHAKSSSHVNVKFELLEDVHAPFMHYRVSPRRIGDIDPLNSASMKFDIDGEIVEVIWDSGEEKFELIINGLSNGHLANGGYHEGSLSIDTPGGLPFLDGDKVDCSVSGAVDISEPASMDTYDTKVDQWGRAWVESHLP